MTTAKLSKQNVVKANATSRFETSKALLKQWIYEKMDDGTSSYFEEAKISVMRYRNTPSILAGSRKYDCCSKFMRMMFLCGELMERNGYEEFKAYCVQDCALDEKEYETCSKEFVADYIEEKMDIVELKKF